MLFHYVYILQSELDCDRYYVGLTDDLHDRLKRHNAGEMIHTSKWRPWRIKTAVAFTNRDRAVDFERYLKTASGRAFASDYSLRSERSGERGLPRRSPSSGADGLDLCR